MSENGKRTGKFQATVEGHAGALGLVKVTARFTGQPGCTIRHDLWLLGAAPTSTGANPEGRAALQQSWLSGARAAVLIYARSSEYDCEIDDPDCWEAWAEALENPLVGRVILAARADLSALDPLPSAESIEAAEVEARHWLSLGEKAYQISRGRKRAPLLRLRADFASVAGLSDEREELEAFEVLSEPQREG